MNRKLKTSIAVILITLAAVSSAMFLTGCGEDKGDTKSTTPATTAATKATQAATAAQAQANNQTQSQAQAITNAPAQSNDSQAGSNDIGISEADAIANVKQQAGSGAQIISSYPGTSPEGFPAWIITVAPVSNSADTPNVVYYSGFQFCYPAQDNNSANDINNNSNGENGIGVSEADAIANVKQQAGSGAQIISSYPGTTPDGLPAWVITVAPVSNSADTPNVVYYSGYQFCYPAQ